MASAFRDGGMRAGSHERRLICDVWGSKPQRLLT